MLGLVIRIVLRYLSGALVVKGLIDPEMANGITHDPDIATAIEVGSGLALGAISEGWYFLARRFGWAK